MISSRSRDIGPAALMLAVIAAGLLLYARFAHAGTDPASTAPPPGIGWPEYLAIGLAALAGVRVIVDALLAFFKMLAPRTKTTADDTIRDDLQLAHDKLDSIARLVQGITPPGTMTMSRPTPDLRGATGTPGAALMALQGGPPKVSQDEMIAAQAGITLPKRDPQAGTVNGYMVVSAALMTLALAVPVIAGSCTHGSTARQSAASGVVAALDCEAGNIDAQALADAKVYAEDTVQRWISGVEAKPSAEAIKAVLVRIRSDVGKCAIAGALAAATVVVTQQPGTVVSALSAGDPVQLRAAFAVAARQAGWAPVKIQGGAVL